MLRLLIVLVVGYCGMAQAKVSPQCSSCLKECPHDSKILLSCDSGCPDSCSPFEVTEFKQTYAPSIPTGCRACMSDCPHESKEMRECDRGCPDSCSRTQAAAYKKQKGTNGKSGDCYSCMSQCPHLSRDFKACDSGCPDVCDGDGMRKAFLKANEKAKACGQSDDASDSEGTAR